MAYYMGDALWSGRKCHFGLPLSFTKYIITEDRLIQRTGVLNLRFEEIVLYKIRDITLSRSFGERIFGVGSITVISSDKTQPKLVLESIKDSSRVKELIHRQAEDLKIARRVHYSEYAAFVDDMDDQLDQDK